VQDKRKFQRFSVDMPGAYYLEASGRTRTCRIKEISREGTKLSLHTRHKINVGSRLKIEVKQGKNEAPIRCIMSVAWVAELQSGGRYRYACGGAFEVIRNEDRWRLLDSAYEGWKDRASQPNPAC